MPDLKFPKKKRCAKKLTASKVQEYFNAAIRRRDNCCMTAHSPCAGNLECSHFFAKGWKDRQHERARTFEGIAKAMAEQWG